MPKNKKLALNSGKHTYQTLTNDNEVCIPSLSSILLAVLHLAHRRCYGQRNLHTIHKRNGILFRKLS